MKTIRFRVVLAAFVVLLGTFIARAQTTAGAPPMHGRHGFGHGGNLMEMADYLNLSDAQLGQMKSIMQKEHPAMKPLMQQMHQINQQLKQCEEGTCDETKVRGLATQQAATMVELTVQKTRIHSQMYQVLTADQQTQLKQLEARRAARMQKHINASHQTPPEQ